MEITDIAESLLWENVSHFIEGINEYKKMVQAITYIDREKVNEVEKCEVFDAEEFCVLQVENINEKIAIEFEMPFLMSCWNNTTQLFRVTACAKGKCEIPSEDGFNYTLVNFNKMNREQLLEYGYLIKICDMEYQDVEVDSMYL